MTHGVRKDTGRALFQKALALNPSSAVALTEYASGLLKLEGEPRLPQASRLYRQALDATQQLEVDMARWMLQD